MWLVCLVFTVAYIEEQNGLTAIKDMEITYQFQFKFFPRVTGGFGVSVSNFVSGMYILRNFFSIKCEN